MASSLFLLPVELRLEVYRYLLIASSQPLILHPSIQGSQFRGEFHTAILRTCKTMYSEALPLLYDENTLRISLRNSEGFSEDVYQRIADSGGHAEDIRGIIEHYQGQYTMTPTEVRDGSLSMDTLLKFRHLEVITSDRDIWIRFKGKHYLKKQG